MDLAMRFGAVTSYGTTWVLWLLVALSTLALAIAVERAVLFVTSNDDVGVLRQKLRRALELGEIETARRALEESPSFEARVAVAGLDAQGTKSAEERMRGEAELVRISMEKYLSLLGTLGNNAPFIGLLGTVIGIVRSFRELQHSSGQVSAGLMAEIGEALIATAAGLMVALPAVAFYNFFQRLIQIRLARAEALTREILAFRKADVTVGGE